MYVVFGELQRLWSSFVAVVAGVVVVVGSGVCGIGLFLIVGVVVDLVVLDVVV